MAMFPGTSATTSTSTTSSLIAGAIIEDISDDEVVVPTPTPTPTVVAPQPVRDEVEVLEPAWEPDPNTHVRMFAYIRPGLRSICEVELKKKLGISTINTFQLRCVAGFDLPYDYDVKQFYSMTFGEMILMKLYHFYSRRRITPHEMINVLVRSPCYEDLTRVASVFDKFGVKRSSHTQQTVGFCLIPCKNQGDLEAENLFENLNRDILFLYLTKCLEPICRKNNWKLETVPVLPNSTDVDFKIIAFASPHEILIGVEMIGGLEQRQFLQYCDLPGPICAKMLTKANIQENDVVLDLSCGAGNLLFEVLSNVNCLCIGVEFDHSKLTRALENLRQFARFYPRRAAQIQFLNADVFSGFFNFFTVDKIVCELVHDDEPVEDVERMNEIVDSLLMILSDRCRPQCRSVIALPESYNPLFLKRLEQSSVSKIGEEFMMVGTGFRPVVCYTLITN